jgi:hypothetical protein
MAPVSAVQHNAAIVKMSRMIAPSLPPLMPLKKWGGTRFHSAVLRGEIRMGADGFSPSEAHYLFEVELLRGFGRLVILWTC